MNHFCHFSLFSLLRIYGQRRRSPVHFFHFYMKFNCESIGLGLKSIAAMEVPQIPVLLRSLNV